MSSVRDIAAEPASEESAVPGEASPLPPKVPLAGVAAEALDPAACLEATPTIDSDHPALRAFVETHCAHLHCAHLHRASLPRAGLHRTDQHLQREKAIALFYAVRDQIRYDVRDMRFDPEHYRASAVLARGGAYCIPKAVLLTAAARAAGIPASLGFGDVRNHLASPQLIQMMGTDVFFWHGNANLYLDGRWVKATPAFNIEMCTRFAVKPLEFDGVHDSLLHPFNAHDERHMEYLLDRGAFVDLPWQRIFASMRRHYPRMAALIEREQLAAAMDGAI